MENWWGGECLSLAYMGFFETRESSAVWELWINYLNFAFWWLVFFIVIFFIVGWRSRAAKNQTHFILADSLVSAKRQKATEKTILKSRTKDDVEDVRKYEREKNPFSLLYFVFLFRIQYDYEKRERERFEGFLNVWALFSFLHLSLVSLTSKKTTELQGTYIHASFYWRWCSYGYSRIYTDIAVLKKNLYKKLKSAADEVEGRQWMKYAAIYVRPYWKFLRSIFFSLTSLSWSFALFP